MSPEAPYRVLLLADSQGFKVKRFISSFMKNRDVPLHLEVRAFSGATIEEVATWGLCEANHRKYDQVFLLARVNNITDHLGYREVKPKFNKWSTMVRKSMIELYLARTRLYRLSDKVIICAFIALHLATYNKSGAAYQEHQVIIENATVRINEYIAEMNIEARIYAPGFADNVHKCRFSDRQIHHRYVATMYDGLHYTQETAAKFSILLLRNILNVRNDLYVPSE